MSMSKKDFIALADMIKQYQSMPENGFPLMQVFTDNQIRELANFCEKQNPRFNRYRWLGYIAGTNGKNGGKVKPTEADKHIAALRASANPDDQNDPWRT